MYAHLDSPVGFFRVASLSRANSPADGSVFITPDQLPLAPALSGRLAAPGALAIANAKSDDVEDILAELDAIPTVDPTRWIRFWTIEKQTAIRERCATVGVLQGVLDGVAAKLGYSIHWTETARRDNFSAPFPTSKRRTVVDNEAIPDAAEDSEIPA